MGQLHPVPDHNLSVFSLRVRGTTAAKPVRSIRAHTCVSPADRLPRGSLFLRGNRGRFVRCNILVELLCNAAYMGVLGKPIPPRRIR